VIDSVGLTERGRIACRTILNPQTLPGTGRGTTRSMVEEAHLTAGTLPETWGPSVSPSAIHLPQQAVGGLFGMKVWSNQILPELVSGRGTAGRSPVVEGPPFAAEFWRTVHSLRSRPSVSPADCHLPETSSGRISGFAHA
jgi:hypothetical protein